MADAPQGKVTELPDDWTLILWNDGGASLRKFTTKEGGYLPAETLTALRETLTKGESMTTTPPIEEASFEDIDLLGDTLDDDLHVFIDDWADTHKIASLSVALAVIENIATELGSVARAETASFVFALGRFIGGQTVHAEANYEKLAEANQALQQTIAKAQAQATPPKGRMQ